MRCATTRLPSTTAVIVHPRRANGRVAWPPPRPTPAARPVSTRALFPSSRARHTGHGGAGGRSGAFRTGSRPTAVSESSSSVSDSSLTRPFVSRCLKVLVHVSESLGPDSSRSTSWDASSHHDRHDHLHRRSDGPGRNQVADCRRGDVCSDNGDRVAEAGNGPAARGRSNDQNLWMALGDVT